MSAKKELMISLVGAVHMDVVRFAHRTPGVAPSSHIGERHVWAGLDDDGVLELGDLC